MLWIMRVKQKTVETLAINLRMLMDAYGVSKQDLAIKSGISERMIGYILACERKATIQTADDLAKAFKLTGWQLIMPNLNVDPNKNNRLEQLIENYSNASSEARDYIDKVAERETKYTQNKKTG